MENKFPESKEFVINSLKSINDFVAYLASFWLHWKYIQVVISCKRKLSQNRAIRECYKQIKEYNEGWTAKHTERYCKYTYGVPILRASSEVDNYVFGKILPPLSFEQCLTVMDTFAVTSKMTPKQAHEMIQSMVDDHPYIHLDKTKKGKYF